MEQSRVEYLIPSSSQHTSQAGNNYHTKLNSCAPADSATDHNSTAGYPESSHMLPSNVLTDIPSPSMLEEPPDGRQLSICSSTSHIGSISMPSPAIMPIYPIVDSTVFQYTPFSIDSDSWSGESELSWEPNHPGVPAWDLGHALPPYHGNQAYHRMLPPSMQNCSLQSGSSLTPNCIPYHPSALLSPTGVGVSAPSQQNLAISHQVSEDSGPETRYFDCNIYTPSQELPDRLTWQCEAKSGVMELEARNPIKYIFYAITERRY